MWECDIVDFYVFDLQLNFIGVLDNYINIPIKRHYEQKTSFEIEVAPTKENFELLQKDRLIVKKTDLSRAYIIETIDYEDGSNDRLSATVFSLHHLLNRRVIPKQQTFSGAVGKVMSNFVNANAINPTNKNRVIPNLTSSSANNNLGKTTTEAKAEGYLDDILFEIANKHNLSWDILLDHTNKKFVFKVWQGVDRSQNQNNNDCVIFAKEFDNVINQNYTNSDNGYRNVAFVTGQDEEYEEDIVSVIVNDTISGFERREIFVDASNISDETEDGYLTQQEYKDLLIEQGKSVLDECKQILGLESEVDVESSFIFDKDYFLGDVVSIKNTKIGLIMHPRIIEAIETYTKNGVTLQISFGSSVPTLIQQIKKAVR